MAYIKVYYNIAAPTPIAGGRGAQGTVRDGFNPQGNIAIEVTGLRPGEKLYEELLIGGDVSGTKVDP